MVIVWHVLVSDPFKSTKTNQPVADPFSSNDPFSAAFSSKSSVSTGFFPFHLFLNVRVPDISPLNPFTLTFIKQWHILKTRYF